MRKWWVALAVAEAVGGGVGVVGGWGKEGWCSVRKEGGESGEGVRG